MAIARKSTEEQADAIDSVPVLTEEKPVQQSEAAAVVEDKPAEQVIVTTDAAAVALPPLPVEEIPAPQPAAAVNPDSLEEVIKKHEFDIIDDIINFIRQLDAIISNELSDELKRTHEIVIFALQVVVEAGAKFKDAEKNTVKALSDFNENKQRYVSEIAQLGVSFTEIVITESTVSLWRKLGIWMQALHDQTANCKALKDTLKRDDKNRIIPEKDGVYPHISLTDYFFKKFTRGVSKYTLIHPWGVAARDIQDAVKVFDEKSAPRLGN
jgi:hypothetical protein